MIQAPEKANQNEENSSFKIESDPWEINLKKNFYE